MQYCVRMMRHIKIDSPVRSPQKCGPGEIFYVEEKNKAQENRALYERR